MQKSMSFNDVAFIYVKGKAYRIHFWYMSKDDQLASWKILIWLIKKVFFKFFLLYIKNEWEKLLSKEQRCITKYYGTGKERFTEHARDKYRKFSEEEKNKQREYRKNRYHSLKQKLKEYQTNYREAKKSQWIISEIIF